MEAKLDAMDFYVIIGKQKVEIEVLSSELNKAKQRIKELTEGQNVSKQAN
jgi:hypothetical protein